MYTSTCLATYTAHATPTPSEDTVDCIRLTQSPRLASHLASWFVSPRLASSRLVSPRLFHCLAVLCLPGHGWLGVFFSRCGSSGGRRHEARTRASNRSHPHPHHHCAPATSSRCACNVVAVTAPRQRDCRGDSRTHYAGWRKKQKDLLAKATDLASRWLINPANTALADELHAALYGSEQLANMFDQCASVALVHRMYPAMKVAMLESVADQHYSVLLSGERVDHSQLLQPATALTDLLYDPLGALVRQTVERRIELIGQPIADALAEGKPVNQANALLHCSSEIVMVNDMNQG
jgi:hypothetical protein